MIKVLCVILWKIVYKCVCFLFVCCMCIKLDCGPTKLTRCPFAHLSMDEFFFFGIRCLSVCLHFHSKQTFKGRGKNSRLLGRYWIEIFFYTENKNRFSVAAMNWLLDILAFCVAAVIFFIMHVFVGFCLIFFSKFLQFQ